MNPNRPTRSHPSRPVLKTAAVLGGLFISLFINFHWYLPDFNLVPGDQGDTRLVIFTLEHWFHAFQGLEPFFRLQMFYPDSNALAYADGLFLFGLPYSLFRWGGMDHFTSYQLLQVLMTGIGYIAWVQVLRTLLKISTGLAVVGGVLLSSLNALQLQADIGKLSAVNLFPILILWLWAYLSAKDRGHWRALLGLVGFAAGLGLLFFSSYYPAWLFLFSLVVLGSAVFIAGGVSHGPQSASNRMWGDLTKHRWHVLLALSVFTLALIPFLITYAPLVAAGSKRGFDLVLEFSPTLRDVVNVSPSNVVWSPVMRMLGFDFGNREVQMGTPGLVLLLAGITLLAALMRVRTAGWRGLSSRDRLLLLLAATAAALVTFSLRFGDHSLWYVVYKTVPGASALRAIGRMLIIMDLIVVVLAVCGLQELADRWRSKPSGGRVALPILLAAVSVWLVAEQVNWTPFQLRKAEQLALLERYTAPDLECAAFYVDNTSSEGLPFGYYQLDAMMIGMKLGIPTVNGYSGFEPHEVFTLAPRGSEYQYRMLDWLQSHGAMEGICELDLSDGEFRAVDVAAEYPTAQQAYRTELLEDFSILFAASTHFLKQGNSLANLFPEYLEENGFLDASFGYQTGARYRWLQDRYWIGEKACGNRKCFGIAAVGSYSDLEPILERYGSQARGVFFPSPQTLDPGIKPADDVRGELLLTFPLGSEAH